MSDELDHLRIKLRSIQDRIGDEESRLQVLQDTATAAIANLESQKAVLESLKSEMQDIENEILSKSGLYLALYVVYGSMHVVYAFIHAVKTRVDLVVVDIIHTT